MSDRDVDDLLERVAGGDESAFADLYDALAPYVYGLALHLVKDRPAAGDATVDAFLHVWRCAGEFDRTRVAGRAWVFSFTYRAAIRSGLMPIRAR